MLNRIKDKVISGEQLTFNDGSYLINEADLLAVGQLAQISRWKHNTSPIVTYVVDTNLNYTNICDAYCSFCAFYRTDENDPSAYTYTVDEIMERIRAATKKGVRTVLMQGGLNKNLPLEYYIDMVKKTRKLYPDITAHFWSAPEICKMSEVSGLSYKQVFQKLWDAGQRTMPGGGSEILSDRVKREISRFAPKNSWKYWTKVHEAAHSVGFKTTATMMFGHVETNEEIIESLIHIRNVQNKSIDNANGSGFTAFIPWSYKRDNTALAKKVPYESGPNRYLRIIATSRLMLDNIQHIQTSWFSESKKIGQIALGFGADDFGGTLFEENVMLAAGFYNRITVTKIRKLISDSGYIPAERLTNYNIVKIIETEQEEAKVN